MATSGSVDYSRTVQQIINGALRGLGVIESGEAPSAPEAQDALETLNLMVKSFQAKGYHLWTLAEATLFLDAATTTYTMDGSSSRAVSTYGETALAADVAVSATSFTVDSISGIADGDVIGIVTSSTAIHWTTVNGAPSGSTVTVDDAFTTTASEDAAVYFYTASADLINRPLRIEHVRRRDVSGTQAIDTAMEELAKVDYYDLPNKSESSTPVNFYYDPGRDSGTLYIWPASSIITNLLTFTYVRPIEDLDALSNNFDFPQEWLETLKYQLMIRLAHEYGIPLRQDVIALATTLLEDMMAWDTEPVSVCFL